MSLFYSFTALQGNQMIRKKNAHFFKKYPKQSLSQKSQNIYYEAKFDSQKHLHQTTFETLK